jgi:protein gp37
MQKTKIDWCDSVCNPVIGCSRGCEYCYAKKLNSRFKWIADFEKPEFRPGQLEKLKVKTPKTVFIGSMCDLFADDVTDEWIQKVLYECDAAPQHRYLFLTKNPMRYEALKQKNRLPIGKNYYYGATLVNNKGSMWFSLKYTSFVSIEPILGKFNKYDIEELLHTDWVIVGAETGHRKGKIIPKREWIEDIVCSCRAANVPVFLKNSLAKIWGEPLIQEFPWEV